MVEVLQAVYKYSFWRNGIEEQIYTYLRISRYLENLQGITTFLPLSFCMLSGISIFSISSKLYLYLPCRPFLCCRQNIYFHFLSYEVIEERPIWRWIIPQRRPVTSRHGNSNYCASVTQLKAADKNSGVTFSKNDPSIFQTPAKWDPLTEKFSDWYTYLKITTTFYVRIRAHLNKVKNGDNAIWKETF
jgi:hypothetical protein